MKLVFSKTFLERKPVDMRTIYLFLVINSLFVTPVQSQQLNSDRIQIHKQIFERLRSNNFNVLTVARAQEFKNFRFNNPSGIDTSDAVIYNRTDWKSFLSSVETSNIKDYSLQVEGKELFKSKNHRNRRTLVFSPIVIDSTKTRAVCITTIIGKKSGFQNAWYLTRENNKWKIDEDQLLSIFD